MAMNVGGDGDLNADINVTPLVDVMLVLLIIFMITAPMLNTGVSLDLPKVTAENIDDPNGPLVLSIKEKKLVFAGTAIKWSELETKLKTNAKVQKESSLYIGAEDNAPYGWVAKAMAIAKNAGVTRLMLLTTPVDKLDLENLDKNTGP